MGQHRALVLSLGGSWVGQPAGSLHPHHQGGLPSTAPASSPYVARRKGQGWFSCFHVPRAGSSTPVPPGPALLDCPGEMQGPLSLVLQMVRGWVSSPNCHRWRWVRAWSVDILTMSFTVVCMPVHVSIGRHRFFQSCLLAPLL